MLNDRSKLGKAVENYVLKKYFKLKIRILQKNNNNEYFLMRLP
jgi:hypothetical protein